jgi:2-keto-3-deoxy-L-rhamnonate aldolase RhmA
MRGRLQSGRVLWGASLTRVASTAIVELYGMLGLDFVWIDMEHSDFDFREVSVLALAARSVQISAVVRVSQNDPKAMLKCLESGADGIIVPDVRDAAQAAAAAGAARFFPDGTRGLAGSDVRSRYGLLPLPSYIERANEETAVIVQIEHPDGVAQAEAITAVPGVDLVFVGKMDLSQNLGVPGQVSHLAVTEATGEVASVCRRLGKGLGLAAGTLADVRGALALGANLLVIASEMALIRTRLQEMLAGFRELSKMAGGGA